jgi:hypothetical protein
MDMPAEAIEEEEPFHTRSRSVDRLPDIVENDSDGIFRHFRAGQPPEADLAAWLRDNTEP